MTSPCLLGPRLDFKHKQTIFVFVALKENADQEVNVSEKTGISTQTILVQTWSKSIENQERY